MLKGWLIDLLISTRHGDSHEKFFHWLNLPFEWRQEHRNESPFKPLWAAGFLQIDTLLIDRVTVSSGWAEAGSILETDYARHLRQRYPNAFLNLNNDTIHTSISPQYQIQTDMDDTPYGANHLKLKFNGLPMTMVETR